PLPRERLLDRMLIKRARLTVLLTDTGTTFADPELRSFDEELFGPRFDEYKLKRGGEALEALISDAEGVVDLTSGPRDQSWATDAGGLFTNAFIDVLENPTKILLPRVTNWKTFLTKVSEEENARFVRLKKEAKAPPDSAPAKEKEAYQNLRKQTEQRP